MLFFEDGFLYIKSVGVVSSKPSFERRWLRRSAQTDD